VPAGTAAAPKKGLRSAFLVVGIMVLLLAIGAGSIFAYNYLKSKSKPAAAALPQLKVGVLMAFTGGSSSMGYGEMKGIQLAKKQLGADNIQFVQMDSQCDKTVAPDAMKRLINQQVVAVIGDGCSSASVAALPIANENKVVMVSPSASSPSLSIPDDYFFRVVPPDNFQGAFLAQSIYAKGIKSVAIFYTNEPYGQNMNKVFTQKFTALGGKVLTSQTADSDVIDLGNQINAIKASKPQAVVFVPNSVVSGVAALKLARQAGISVPFYGGDGLYDHTLIANAKQAAEGLTITSFPTGTKAFKQLLLTEYQGEQLYAAAQGYDAFTAIYQAIKNGAKTGPQIKDQLPKLSFDGVSAHIKFDANGEISDPNYKYDLLTVKDGSFVAATE
jgi:branched-chain amino acid transport system substrate-binding protein